MTKISEAMNKSANFSEIDYLKKFSKDMLKNTIFTGTFQERRFVESLNSYRDVVGIDEEEKDFIENLMAVKRRIEETFVKRPWIGITEPDTIGAPSDYSLWVLLPEESPALGKYWYRVKTVEFPANEIRLKLEVVRPFKENTSKKKDDSDTCGSVNLIEDIRQQLTDNIWYFYNCILTYQNIKNSVIFTAVLVSTIVAGGFNAIKYLLDYILKFIREISGLVKAFTPVLIHFLNMTTRIIFGFYNLIGILLKGRPNPQPVYNAYYNIDPQKLRLPDPRERYNQYYPRELPYYPRQRSGATITPLDD